LGPLTRHYHAPVPHHHRRRPHIANPTPHPQERHNIEMLKSSPFVNMGSKRTPKVALHNPNNYEISPYR